MYVSFNIRKLDGIERGLTYNQIKRGIYQLLKPGLPENVKEDFFYDTLRGTASHYGEKTSSVEVRFTMNSRDLPSMTIPPKAEWKDKHSITEADLVEHVVHAMWENIRAESLRHDPRIQEAREGIRLAIVERTDYPKDRVLTEKDGSAILVTAPIAGGELAHRVVEWSESLWSRPEHAINDFAITQLSKMVKHLTNECSLPLNLANQTAVWVEQIHRVFVNGQKHRVEIHVEQNALAVGSEVDIAVIVTSEEPFSPWAKLIYCMTFNQRVLDFNTMEHHDVLKLALHGTAVLKKPTPQDTPDSNQEEKVALYDSLTEQ